MVQPLSGPNDRLRYSDKISQRMEIIFPNVNPPPTAYSRESYPKIPNTYSLRALLDSRQNAYVNNFYQRVAKSLIDPINEYACLMVWAHTNRSRRISSTNWAKSCLQGRNYVCGEDLKYFTLAQSFFVFFAPLLSVCEQSNFQ